MISGKIVYTEKSRARIFNLIFIRFLGLFLICKIISLMNSVHDKIILFIVWAAYFQRRRRRHRAYNSKFNNILGLTVSEIYLKRMNAAWRKKKKCMRMLTGREKMIHCGVTHEKVLNKTHAPIRSHTTGAMLLLLWCVYKGQRSHTSSFLSTHTHTRNFYFNSSN